MTDWIDKSVLNQERELKRSIAAARQAAPHVKQIKAGDEVLCAECLEPIPCGRIEAHPDSTHCVDCLSELEG
ncbi:hypothetical protein [Vibrio sp. LaRot3]|uniref:hypothetical protein n=1 Tax=Vibrio sp. LaRot3 TaxID=2998829 RepID=UPI0022CDFF80|nr:hypothetical protein [Vibrio sp. LaRot3]MDA0148840.1 hypothetical protein [Vibrio sp. LaRot3]